MKHATTLFKSIVFLLLFWLLFFDIQRIIFFLFHYNEIAKSSELSEILGVFTHSLRVDLSTAGYLMALFVLAKLLSNYFPSKITQGLVYLVFYSELLLICLVHSGELVAYYEWGHKLTSRVFMHLSTPDEVFRTAEYSAAFLFFGVLLFELAVGAYLAYKFKFLSRINPHESTSKIRRILMPAGIALGSLCVFFLFARGGWQQIPINIDASYYSSDQVLNDISVNSAYFFGNSFVVYNKSDLAQHIPEVVEKENMVLMDSLFSFERNHDRQFITAKKPNLVFLIMEGWSANVMRSINPGQKTATPNFDQLSKSGVLFSNIYATNTTSEIGNTSIFAGYPSIPENAISLFPDKHRKLPTINQELKKQGYSTHYLFSGDLKYGNIKGFLMEHEFDELADENDFPAGLKKGKLNYYDKDLYAFLLKKIDKSAKHPFLQCAFTGSTHSPYDYPQTGKKKFSGEEMDYLNSMVYADKCLGDFIKKCKTKSWYKNTIFVIISDHGHATPMATTPYDTKFFNIPLLFFGEPIAKAYKGKVMRNIGSQGDIAGTLLKQLGLDNSKFIFSKDLMSPNVKEFAFHATIRGYGYVNPMGSYLSNFDSKRITSSDLDPETTFENTLHQGEGCLYRFYKHFEQLDRK